MVGDELDMSHPDLGTLSRLDLSQVSDLSGIEYFTGLDSLYLQISTQWPQTLPPSITYLRTNGSPDGTPGPYTTPAPTLQSLSLYECRLDIAEVLVIPPSVKRFIIADCGFIIPQVLLEGLEYCSISDVSGQMAAQSSWPAALDTLYLWTLAFQILQPCLSFP